MLQITVFLRLLQCQYDQANTQGFSKTSYGDQIICSYVAVNL